MLANKENVTPSIPVTERRIFSIELTIYAVQVLTFALVAFMISNFLSDEAALQKILAARINDLSPGELGLTLLSIIIVIGVLSYLKELTGISFFDEILPAVYEEFPRTIYLFGSSIGGTLLTLSLYLIFSRKSQSGDINLGYGTFMMALLFVIVFFFAGYLFKIKAKNVSKWKDSVSQ